MVGGLQMAGTLDTQEHVQLVVIQQQNLTTMALGKNIMRRIVDNIVVYVMDIVVLNIQVVQQLVHLDQLVQDVVLSTVLH